MEDELLDELADLPDPDRVSNLIAHMRGKDVRALAMDVVNGSVVLLRDGGGRGTLAKTINEWIATAEATVDIGPRLSAVVKARRRMERRHARQKSHEKD